jgi:hypothetical protein
MITRQQTSLLVHLRGSKMGKQGLVPNVEFRIVVDLGEQFLFLFLRLMLLNVYTDEQNCVATTLYVEFCFNSILFDPCHYLKITAQG